MAQTTGPRAGVGVELFETARMQRALERHPSLAERVFTDEERAWCGRSTLPAQRYAACFAARRAVLKALGAEDVRDFGVRDVSVAHEGDRPVAVLAGRAEELACKGGVREIALSLSSAREVAVANAVAVTDEVRPPREERRDAATRLAASFREARSVLDELERVEMAAGGQDDARPARPTAYDGGSGDEAAAYAAAGDSPAEE